MTLLETIARMPATYPAGIRDFREAAALTAANGFGRKFVEQAPALINCGALALALGSNPQVHELRADVLDLIEGTDLRSVPPGPPAFLRSAVIIEARGQTLFGATTDLGIYQVPDGRYGLLGYTGRHADGGIQFALWRPHWAPDDLEDPEIVPAMDGESEGLATWIRDAVRFTLVYGLLLEAERSPVCSTGHRDRRKRSVEARDKAFGRTGWRRSYVSLTIRVAAEARESVGTCTVAGNRTPEMRTVSGHLKRQPYGPGRTGRRWIYVESYDARRWIAPGPRRIIVQC